MKQLVTKILPVIVLGLAIIALIVTTVYLGWPGSTILIAGIAAVLGAALFLKSKDLMMRIAGLLFLGLGLLWLVLLPVLIFAQNQPVP